VIKETHATHLKGATMQHTTTQPRIAAISSTNQTVFKKSTFVIGLAALGSITILGGIISLVSVIILLSNAALPNLSRTILFNAIVDLIVGALIIASSRTFAQGKTLTIWFLGGSILLDSLYSLVRGYELHYLFTGLGFIFIWQMLKFKKEWETL
jgi:hypothetical protein